jgi:hypothetical protein
MSARVFISCGQRDGEREIAQAVAQWFATRGYRPYVALEAQSIQNVNSGILGELRCADYYVFIDFRREAIGDGGDERFRGSLFSHQELAIAYAMGFEHAIFFREAGVKLEGVCAYLASNATRFEDRNAVPSLVAQAVELRNWQPEYSRNLVVGPLRMSDEPIQYRDLRGRFLYADVQNRRPDVGATGVVARLSAFQLAGQPRQVSPNRSHLKVTGQQLAFQQTIWPCNHGAFDLLCVDLERGSCVYLNNALDVLPRPVLFDCAGEHVLEYEVFAHGFDVVRFAVRLHATSNCADASAVLLSEGAV